MTVSPVGFFVLAALILGGGVAVVVVPSLVHAAYALAATLFGVGLLFVAGGAELAGAVQILFGAIAIPLLVLTALSMTSTGGAGRSSQGRQAVALGVALITAAGLATVLYAARGDWHVADWPQRLADDGSARTLARSLLTQAVLPLGVAGLLVAVAVVAALTLGRIDEHERDLERVAQQRRDREERIRRRRQDRTRGRGGRPGLAGEEDAG